MRNSTTIKEVADVKIGRYKATLDEESLSIIHTLSNSPKELQQIQEMTDWLLELCCDHVPDDQECLKYMKYLKNIRGAFEYLQSIDVKMEGGER